MERIRVIIEVKGGCVTDVFVPPGCEKLVDVTLVDYDDLDEIRVEDAKACADADAKEKLSEGMVPVPY